MATLSKLDKLNYSIGIIDKVTGPVNKVMAKINQLSQQTAAAQDQMMRGAATAVGGGYALAKSLAPAIDHVAALGEVQSLGVADDALQKLTKTSYEFGFQFGGNSAEFVRSAYDIQSAIAGLTGDELSEFTKTSNILAVATKADAATITSYMGTMYGIFEKTANKMGKSNWVNQIAGQTATAVQLYKTTGAEMQAAFSNLGATATNIGLSSAQQFALVGELQLVAKSGSVAGTQAASLLQGIGKAQQSLGIQLTDDNGDMLAIDVVLGRINNRLSSLGSVARGDVLTQIFGKQGAKAVDVLSTKVDKLKDGIAVFEGVQDNSKAAEMANIIASPWDRMGGSFNAAATAMGNRLLPVVEPFVEVLASMFAGIVSLTEEFPFLSSVIATAVVGVVALMTAFGIATFAMGLYNFATGIGITLTNAQLIVTKLWQGALIALRVAGFLSLIATMGAAAIAMGTFKAVMLAGQAATWLFNAALWANPLTWIVIAAVALIAAVAALIYYFDDITAAFNEWAESSTVFKYLKVAFDLLTLPLQLVWRLIKTIAVGVYDFFAPAFSAISSVVMGMVNAIGSAFSYVGNLLSSFGGAITGFFSGMGSSVSGFFTGIWQSAVDIIESLINYLTETFGFLGDFFGGIASGISGIFDGVSSFISAIADNGVLNSVISFFSDDEPAKVSNKVEQVTQAVQPQTMVMQSADQAYSRDYGQSVISKASAPAQQASSQYIAPNSPINYAAPKVTAIVETEEPRTQALAGPAAANDPAYSAQPKVMTEREAANDAFKFTSQRLPAVPTDSTAPLNLQAQARSQTLINNAFPSEQNNAVNNSAVTSSAVNATQNNAATAVNSATNAAQNNAATAIDNATSATQNNAATAINNATNAMQNNAATVTNSATSTKALAAVNSSVNNATQNSLASADIAAQPKAMTEREAANDAFKFTSQRLPAVPTDSTAPLNLQAQARSQALINNAFPSEQNKAVTVANNNITNSANSPVYNAKQAQLVSVNQGAAPEPALPSVKTDQIITNTASNSAEKAQQISAEQQATAYKPKLQTSAYLQSLTNNSSNTNNNSNSSDSSKHISIENVNFKSDDLAQSFEQMMELAG
ncbi:phage tail tape measure protein [Pseudoalteromonas sp. NGC95]|uniref:phage tail tape measure protein n=1 Tax=Pseudoalteromonas sp. NGC95 TaxID=2792051 RepID=UPI0018CCE90C|nr:phage tail tape measure protein [Pseudoalteromonas sp. NGC95]MBH0017565.1 phage tail tape measure protein [Pseudoalteromonas sp. NGC95]